MSFVIQRGNVFSYSRLRGFTLLEVMITVSIVAILAALALPSFREVLVNSNVSGHTNELVGALNMARAEAVKRGVDVAVEATGTWDAGWSVVPDGTAEVLTARAAYPATYRVLGVTTGGGANTRVVFRATGALRTATGFDFSVCRPTSSPGDPESRWIRVGASGIISSQRDTSSSPAGSCA